MNSSASLGAGCVTGKTIATTVRMSVCIAVSAGRAVSRWPLELNTLDSNLYKYKHNEMVLCKWKKSWASKDKETCASHLTQGLDGTESVNVLQVYQYIPVI